jgi:response regulator RpfG family c-di-GMP phosphodiesterase
MINVLYIDDEPHNLTSFKASFRRIFNVYISEDTDEARRIVENKIYR